MCYLWPLAGAITLIFMVFMAKIWAIAIVSCLGIGILLSAVIAFMTANQWLNLYLRTLLDAHWINALINQQVAQGKLCLSMSLPIGALPVKRPIKLA